MEELNNKNEGQETTETQNDTITMTKEELEALLQKNGDKRVSEALKKAEKKSAEKIKEASKLAAMNEQEKFVYELEQREKAIAEKEAALALAENKNEASKILADKGISLSLVDFVVAEDAETMNERIKVLEQAFKASVKAEVEKRLSSTSPKKNLPTDKPLTKEDFKKMSMAEQTKLYVDNPELFNEISK